MPQARRNNEPQRARKPPATKRQHQPVQGVHYAKLPELRSKAAEIRKTLQYNGTMSVPLLLALDDLLNLPIDPRYIITTSPTEGKPYESTGLKSVQVQIDRMNAVLGTAHWRKLLHYEDAGTVCCAHVIVGNNLAAAALDEKGNLLPFEAHVLAHRSGWGGHSRGNQRGDLRKGAETNALKRVIAQLGPGSDVYRLDFDEDQNPSSRTPPEPVNNRAQPPETDPVAVLTGLLRPELDDEAVAKLPDAERELLQLRHDCDRGMVEYGLHAAERARRLQANATPEQLRDLRDRISLAIDARENEPSAPSDDA